ncbi:MAG: phosphotransferase enzyme family protein [Gammaproteobacteria bacterium]
MSTPFDRLDEQARTAHLGEVARRALPRWGVAADTPLTLLNISENATWRVDVAGEPAPRILRVHRTGYHTPTGVASELAWTAALQAEAGIPTPQAIAATDGSLIQTVATPALDEERMVVMFEFIPGAEPDASALAAPFRRLGAVAARMHEHVRQWQPPAWFERLTWDYPHSLGEHGNWGRWQDGLGVDAEARAVLGEMDAIIRERLARFGQGRERYGLIHADLRLANLLESDGETRVIDFDDAGFGWYLYDLATALSFMEDRADVPELVESWVAGYRSVRDLPDEDEAEIPTFLMLRRLTILAWIGSHAETDLARELGLPYTHASVALARRYIARFGPAT